MAWGYVAACIFSLAVAASLAEISSSYPISGAQQLLPHLHNCTSALCVLLNVYFNQIIAAQAPRTPGHTSWPRGTSPPPADSRAGR